MIANSPKNRRLAATMAMIAISTIGRCAAQETVPLIDGKKPKFVATSQILVIRKTGIAADKVAKDDYMPTRIVRPFAATARHGRHREAFSIMEKERGGQARCGQTLRSPDFRVQCARGAERRTMSFDCTWYGETT